MALLVITPLLLISPFHSTFSSVALNKLSPSPETNSQRRSQVSLLDKTLLDEAYGASLNEAYSAAAGKGTQKAEAD
ncbi:hypothetical protein C8J56DRAFT_272749 [Mycena floridula]|nr:hypothetical protein C8J56DRAFT_333067 [Mycena floridula]KAJ7580374.1 hypothetical protein C8J56DRAFT_272749 [Mycena floridula]